MLNYYMYYVYIYNYAAEIAGYIFGLNANNDIKKCLDPSIPIAQYYLMGTNQTNQFEDLLVSLVAGTAEDLNIYSSKVNNFIDSAALKVIIKDSTKILCKNTLTSLIGNKPYEVSFICEASGAMLFSTIKQLLKGGSIINFEFLYSNVSEALIDATWKIPASYTKKLINTEFDFHEKYLISEYSYRIISNTNKHLANKCLTSLEDLADNEYLKDLIDNESLTSTFSVENLLAMISGETTNQHD